MIKIPKEKDEKRAVLQHLGAFITSEVAPGKEACEECIRKSDGALSRRNWTAIKYFVKNEIDRRKKMLK